jgi:predicted PurR-regulated permease PerM
MDTMQTDGLKAQPTNSHSKETNLATPETLAKAEAPIRPREHNTIVRVSLFIIAVLLCVGAFTYLERILAPFVFAILLFFVIQPIVEWLHEYHVPRWLAWVVMFVAVTAAFAGIGYLAISSFTTMIQDQEQYVPRMAELAERVRPGLGDSVHEWVKAAEKATREAAPLSLYGATEFGLMMIFYLIFLALTSREFLKRAERAFPERADELLGVARRISAGMQSFVRVKTLVSLGMGVTATLLLAAFQVPYWPMWGFLFFALNYITYIGSIIACVPPIATAYLQFDPVTASIISALVVAVRVVWIDYVEIRYSGSELNLDPSLVLLSLAYWGYFWGGVGLVLAVPMLTTLKIVLWSIEHTRHWAVLISETGDGPIVEEA